MRKAFEILVHTLSVLLGATLAQVARGLGWRTPEPADPTPRLRRVGPYALVDKIAAGAMGEVYRARHLGSGHLRALKLLSHDASPREHAQFDNEVNLGARLSHPNTVSAQEHGQAEDGTRFFAMELVDGITLQALVEREGPQRPERVIGILLQVAAALGEVHELGLLHCDIKPSNVILCRGVGPDRVKLLDFGLVKRLNELPVGNADHVVGTPLYISPEALTSPQAMDGRSDLYGLGALAFFLLSGAPVFRGGSLIEVFSQHLVAVPARLSTLVGWAVPGELEALVLDCLAKDPAARPANAHELIDRLERCAHVSSVGRAVRWLPPARSEAERHAAVERAA